MSEIPGSSGPGVFEKEMSMFGDWKVKISDDGFGHYVNVYIYREYHNSNIEVAFFTPDGTMTQETYLKGSTIPQDKATMRLIDHDILVAIQRALSEKGVKTEEESTIRGKHEAQTAHMQDLQHLLGWFMNGRKPLVFDMGNGGTFTQLPVGARPGTVKPSDGR